MFRNRASVTTLLVAMVVAACGGDASGPSTTEPPAGEETTAAASAASDYPVTVTSGGVTATIPDQPAAIVSLSPTATEMLFAIGAGPQVVAVDEYSYHPAEAPVTDLSGFTPNLEAIVAYDPDLVLVNEDIDGIVGALDGVGIPTVVLPTATQISDSYDQIRLLGAVTGRVEAAETLAEEMEAEIEALVSGIEPPAEPLTYYHELGSDGGGSFYSVTSSTFIGEVFGAFGLENIADPADSDGFGYPVLSVEFILDADPDFIFYTNCCGDTPETIAARPGWASVAAVETGSLYELDDDLSSRWGPRMVDFFRLVADALTERAAG